jgi:hypothetical protein
MLLSTTAPADIPSISSGILYSSLQRIGSSRHLDYRHTSIETTLCSCEQCARSVSEGYTSETSRSMGLTWPQLFYLYEVTCLLYRLRNTYRIYLAQANITYRINTHSISTSIKMFI